MELTFLISLVILLYGAIYFIDQLLKSCLNVPYLYFLENLGIQIQPLQVHIFTTLLNRPISKLSFSNKRFLKIWFTLGVVIIFLILIPSMVLLVKHVVSQFSLKKPGYNQLLLQPMLPGINIPVEECPYYFVTLLLSSVIHEIGHAVAAIGEDVHFSGIGFLILCALPGAYVDISKDGIRNLPPFRQLKIFCAGVWHNIVLAIVAYGIGISLPFLLSPGYVSHKGVYILAIQKNSPAYGENGLNPNDIIGSLNYCTVSNIADWRECLIRTAKNDQVGFCISEEIVHRHDETILHSYARPDGSVECCDHKGGPGLCFELLNDETLDEGVAPIQPYSCLPPRIALSTVSKTCETSSQCTNVGSFCLAPSLRNASRLIKVERSILNGNKTPVKYVLYLGPPSQLYTTITLTNYIPKFFFMPSSLPRVLESFCDYIVKFSGALAILNLVPCIYLDGYWISGAIIDLFLGKYLDALAKQILHVTVTIFGTLLLILTVGFGAWSML